MITRLWSQNERNRNWIPCSGRALISHQGVPFCAMLFNQCLLKIFHSFMITRLWSQNERNRNWIPCSGRALISHQGVPFCAMLMEKSLLKIFHSFMITRLWSQNERNRNWIPCSGRALISHQGVPFCAMLMEKSRCQASCLFYAFSIAGDNHCSSIVWQRVRSFAKHERTVHEFRRFEL